MFDKNGNILPEHSGKEIDYKDNPFIEKCHKATELQKSWEVKKGDQVYYYHHSNLGWRRSFVTTNFVCTDDKLTILDGSAGSSGGHYDYTSVAKIHKSDIIWLPSIEQLLILLNIKNPNDLLSSINQAFYDNYYFQFKNMNEFLLAYYMWHTEKKKWNGEDWVKRDG